MHLIWTKEDKQIKNQKFIWRRFHLKLWYIPFNTIFFFPLSIYPTFSHLLILFRSVFFFSVSLCYYVCVCLSDSFSSIDFQCMFSFSAAHVFNTQCPFPLCLFYVVFFFFYSVLLVMFGSVFGNVLNEWLQPLVIQLQRAYVRYFIWPCYAMQMISNVWNSR